MPPTDVDVLSKQHDKDVYELRLLISQLSHDVSAAHEAIRALKLELAEIKKRQDAFRWFEENLDYLKLLIEQSTWIKQTRHVIIWLASGVAGAVLLWNQLLPFLRDHHK